MPTCAAAVERAFAAFPLAIAGKSVVVKVNAIRTCDPDQSAIVTHPALLKAVIDKLETLGPKRIIVGDSVGTESYGNSGYVFATTGLAAAAGPHYRNLSLNLRLVDVERPFKRRVAVLRDVLEADVYISLREDEDPRDDDAERGGEEQLRAPGGGAEILVPLLR